MVLGFGAGAVAEGLRDVEDELSEGKEVAGGEAKRHDQLSHFLTKVAFGAGSLSVFERQGKDKQVTQGGSDGPTLSIFAVVSVGFGGPGIE